LLERDYIGPYSLFVYENGSVLPVDQGTLPGLDQVQGKFGLGHILGGGPGPGSVASTALGGTVAGPGPTPGAVSLIGAVLFETGKGLLKSGAFDLPCRYGLEKLDRHTHLYIGSAPVEALTPFGKWFRILEVVPLDKRGIKDIGKRYPKASVTARNIPLTSDALRKKLGVFDGGTLHIFGVKSASSANLLLVCDSRSQ